MARFIILTACLLAAGCMGQGDGAPGAAPGGGAAPANALDVYEAAFRHDLQKQPANVTAYLSVDDKDPPAELLKKLRKDWPNLKPVSEEPKEKGLRIYVEDLKWEGGNSAVLKVGHWFPTKFAGEGAFADHHFTLDNGRWVVTQVTNRVSS